MQGASGKLQGKLTDVNDVHEPPAVAVYLNHCSTGKNISLGSV